MRKTKIIATVGPATSTEAPLRDLIAAGVDVFRLNFSHGSHEAHGEVVARIRALAAEAGRSVALLQDLSGPKIRTGLLRDHTPITLAKGDELAIAVGNFLGAPGRVSTSYEYLPSLVKPGDMLLLDDGRIQLRVESSDRQQIRTVVVDGGVLGEHKGINAPGVPLPASGLTEKDKAIWPSASGRRGLRGHELRAERRRSAPGARRAARGRRAGSAARGQAGTPGSHRGARRHPARRATR